ncbi:MAG: transglycosylase domain-containing protein [Bacteroidales bacterium]|nr:transglycosylase domain-containing protein [Bacteroidales bacterium]
MVSKSAKSRKSKKRQKKQTRFKKYFRYLIILFLFIAIIGGLFFFLVFDGAFGPLPGKAKLSSIKNEQASLVFTSDSVLIGKYFAENRTHVGWNDIPQNLVNALVATEDKRFFSHKGYDLRSYFRVLIKSIILGQNSGGGSTLTQQLAKNLYGRKNYGRLSLPINKLKEVIIASRLEDIYNKKELLLLYLNSVPFGENVFGVESAARRYFNKPARNLTTDESAVLVGLLKANTYYDPRLNPKNSLQRRNVVLSLMEKQHYLSDKEADSLKKLPLNLNYKNINSDPPAGYFIYQVKQKATEILDSIQNNTGVQYDLKTDGLKIYTTLNDHLQQLAKDAVKKQLSAIQPILNRQLTDNGFKTEWYQQQKKGKQKKHETEVFDWNGSQIKNMTPLDSLWHYYSMLNAAVLITNPKNGAVLTWIGGNSYNYLPFDMVLSHRQIASAFKPVLYATALENGYGPCTYLNNTEKTYPEYDGWKPENYSHQSTPDSTVALWYALTHSMNIPTVDLYFKVGNEKLLNSCKKLGFPEVSNNMPSIALGSMDLSLEEIVKAYGTFADEGKMNSLFMIEKITNASGEVIYQHKSTEEEDIFDKGTTQILTAILQQVINQGTGRSIRSRYGIKADLAGKTGTSQNYSNAWFMAYTPDIVIGTWVGARTPDVHFDNGYGSGAALALPVAGEVIVGIEKNRELSRQYLTPFNLPTDTYSFLQCDPYRQKGVKGFFNRLIQKKTQPADTTTLKKKENKIINFFKRLFKRK